MNNCIKCEALDDLSANGYCGNCFDYQDQLETRIEEATEALKAYTAETLFETKRSLAHIYTAKLNALMLFADWDIEKAVRVVDIRLGKVAA